MAGRGRPSKFTEEIASRICERLSAGETLRAICRDENMPHEATVRSWALDVENKPDFSTQYAKAREIGYATLFDQLLEIADTPMPGVTVIEKPTGTETKSGDMIEHRRLRVDTRKWMLAKALPKIYGDKQQIEHSGNVNHTINEALTLGRERARQARAAG